MKKTLAPLKVAVNAASDTSTARVRFIMALAFNLVPLAGVAFWGWSAFELIFLYWLENVVIGVRTLAMMLLSARFWGVLPALTVGAFFTVHYGIFCLVHGVFVLAFFGGAIGSNTWSAVPVGPAITIGLAAIVTWQAGLLVLHVVRGDRSNPMELMGAPYPRIIALHLTIMLGGFMLMSLGWPYAGVVALALIKTVLDAGIALRGGSGSLAASPPRAAPSSPPSRSRP
ncbi:MAG: DUF6498-containing protein [Beijerinckiaceae bacterium]|nr:DUF6498-containing protein [Beijerinckiaceae bacterium]